MSMTKSGIFVIIAFLFVACLGSVAISIRNNQHFLPMQLASHARDSANALGLSLTQAMQTGDIKATSRMIDAVFDTGYYQTIAVNDMNGKPLIPTRQYSGDFTGAPQWFIAWLRLEIPQAKASIMQGWSQVGVVQVSANANIAYAMLWNGVLDVVIWFGALIGMTLLLLFYLWLRAKSGVCQHVSQTQQSHQRTLINQVTAFGNWRLFYHYLKNTLVQSDGAGHGAIMVLDINHITSLPSKQGEELTVNTPHAMKILLNKIKEQYPKLFIARVQEGFFYMIAPGQDKTGLDALAQDMMEQLVRLSVKGCAEPRYFAHLGIALYQRGEKAATVIGRANMALITAREQGCNAWHIHQNDDNNDYIRSDWQTILSGYRTSAVTKKQA